MINIEQGINKTLREYMKIFANVIQQANNPLDKVAVLALLLGLKASNFAEKLARKPPTTLVETTKRAYQVMDVEEMLEGKFQRARSKAISSNLNTTFRQPYLNNEYRNNKGPSIMPKPNQ